MIKLLESIHAAGHLTHMPFLTRDEHGCLLLLFCRCDAAAPFNGLRKWKLAIAGEFAGAAIQLHTGFADDVCECSPTAWFDGAWHVSFVAGGGAADPGFRLYRMDGPTLYQLSQPIVIQSTRAGFVHGDRLVYAEAQNIIRVRDRSALFDLELAGAQIFRVAYAADCPELLQIGGSWNADGEFFALECNLKTGEQNFIECDGETAYKWTTLEGQMLYASRRGSHLEDRKIMVCQQPARFAAQAAVVRALHENIVTASASSCGCRGRYGTTRASCLECVEKHLGAAYVLLTETRDGYAHRLRAVGHLHEAEDESQEWMALHAAIRAARKAYQVQGAMPDWRWLQELIEATRSPAPSLD